MVFRIRSTVARTGCASWYGNSEILRGVRYIIHFAGERDFYVLRNHANKTFSYELDMAPSKLSYLHDIETFGRD